MIHEKVPNLKGAGKLVVTFEAEDWVWLCRLLTLILEEGEPDKYADEDTRHLLNVLEQAKRAT